MASLTDAPSAIEAGSAIATDSAAATGIDSEPRAAAAADHAWTFLTNHTHVLLCIFRSPEIRLRDVAALVGITERMVQKIVAELVAAGFVAVTKHGRCNHYAVNPALRLRHPLEAQHSIGELLEILAAVPKSGPARATAVRTASR